MVTISSDKNDIIEKNVAELLKQNDIVVDNYRLRLIHLSDLIERISSINESIPTVSASQVERKVHGTTIATLLEIFNNSRLTYINDSGDIESVNMVVFCKAVSKDEMFQVFVYDKDQFEKLAPAGNLDRTLSNILLSKSDKINEYPVVVHYPSGKCDSTTTINENIDGNITIMQYLDMFYSFGTKYGFALFAKDADSFVIQTVYDLPEQLSYNDRVSLLLNYSNDYVFFKDEPTVIDMCRKCKDTGLVYPSEVVAYFHDTFKIYVTELMSSPKYLIDTATNTTDKLNQDLNELMSQLSELDTTLTVTDTTIGKTQQIILDDSTLCEDKKATVLETVGSSISNVLKSKLAESGIHVENITINTLNIYLSQK